MHISDWKHSTKTPSGANGESQYAAATEEIWPRGQTSDVRKLLEFIEELVADAVRDPNFNTRKLIDLFTKVKAA